MAAKLTRVEYTYTCDWCGYEEIAAGEKPPPSHWHRCHDPYEVAHIPKASQLLCPLCRMRFVHALNEARTRAQDLRGLLAGDRDDPVRRHVIELLDEIDPDHRPGFVPELVRVVRRAIAEEAGLQS